MKKILLIIFSIMILTGCEDNKKPVNNNSNTEKQTVVSDSSVNKLDIVDFITLYEDGISEIYYTVENNTDEEIKYDYIICEMFDKDNNLVYSLKSDLGGIKPNEEKYISSKVTLDLSKVEKTSYSVE